MARPATGGKWRDRSGKLYARITYTHPETRKRITRKALVSSGLMTDLPETLRALSSRVIDEQKSAARSIENERRGPRTYKELIERFVREVVVPPEYDQTGNKTRGMRSYLSVRTHLKAGVAKFGALSLLRITYQSIWEWRKERLASTVGSKDQLRIRSVATVNRELSVMQRALGWAKSKGWIKENPFSQGDERLVRLSLETPRQRILTSEELERLKRECKSSRSRELFLLAVVLAGTGARLSEARRLLRKDIDLEAKWIRYYSYKGPTRRERRVPLTNEVIYALREVLEREEGERIFHFSRTLRESFVKACTRAGLRGVRLHDLRHTAATRLVRGRLSLAETGKLLGHSNPATTYRYVGVDEETRDRARKIWEGAG